MRIIFDDILNEELKSYLLTQESIENVNIIDKDLMSEIRIKFNKKTNPKIILKHICLFQNNDFPFMFEFDKNINKKSKSIKYVIDDMCCEYCYKSLIQDLFDNEFVISAKSNFSFSKPAFNIEFFIKYNDNYDENMLVEYIKEKLN